MVVAFAAAVAAVYADDPKCSATARQCEQQIRQMLSGRRFFGANVELLKPGLVINKVVPDSPAERAGIEVGDRVIAVNGRSLTQATAREYKQVLAEARGNGRVWMIIWRRGAYKRFETRLEPYTKDQIEKIIAAHLSQSHPVAAGAQ